MTSKDDAEPTKPGSTLNVPTILPSEKQVGILRRKMQELGLTSMTAETSIGLPILGLGAKLSYTIDDSLDRLTETKPGDVQGIAASQIQLLNSYYSLVLSQARRSFRWALIAAGISLLFFLASVGFLLYTQLESIAVISLISGALIEVVSAINFYLYGKTASQLAEFHTRLDVTQRFLLANSLCESLEGNVQDKARFELIKKIAGIDANVRSPETQELVKSDTERGDNQTNSEETSPANQKAS